MVVGNVTAMNEERQKIHDVERMVRVEEKLNHVHEKVMLITKTLDKLASDLGTLAGTISSIIFIKDQVAHHEVFIEKYKNYIENKFVSEQDKNSRMKDFFYSRVIPHIITIVVFYFVFVWKQHQTITQIVNSIK